jgi:hypothetical protein
MPTVAEVKAELKSNGIKGYSKKKKAELYEMIKMLPVASSRRLLGSRTPAAPAVIADSMRKYEEAKERAKAAFERLSEKKAKPAKTPPVSKLRLDGIKPEMEESLMNDSFLKKITMGSMRGPENLIEILDGSIRGYSKHAHNLIRLKEYEKTDLQNVYEIDTVGPDITDVPEETNKLIGKIAPVGVWKNLYLTIIPNVTNSKRTKEANVLALVKNMASVRVPIKNPKATPVSEAVTAYNTPWVADKYMPSAWIEAGSKIIVEAIGVSKPAFDSFMEGLNDEMLRKAFNRILSDLF